VARNGKRAKGRRTRRPATGPASRPGVATARADRERRDGERRGHDPDPNPELKPDELEATPGPIDHAAPDVEGMAVFGPAPAPLAMLRGRHRQLVRDRPVPAVKRATPRKEYTLPRNHERSAEELTATNVVSSWVESVGVLLLGALIGAVVLARRD